MADMSKPIEKKPEPVKPVPAQKATRYPEEDFCSREDFELHTMACDQIDSNDPECLEFYLKPYNSGWAMLPGGGRKQYFMKRG